MELIIAITAVSVIFCAGVALGIAIGKSIARNEQEDERMKRLQSEWDKTRDVC